MIDTWLETFAFHLKTGCRVLDLGAGSGRFARLFASQGAIITALDRERGDEDGKGVTWLEAPIETALDDLLGQDRFQAVFARHVLQYFETDWVTKRLIPVLAEILEPGGVLAVETFARPPMPPFAEQHP